VSLIKKKILSAGAFNSVDLKIRILDGIRNEMQVRTIEKTIALNKKSFIYRIYIEVTTRTAIVVFLFY
jgi:hypothetical protein